MFVLVLFSCEQEYTVENTAMVSYAGEWYYELQEETGDLIYEYDYHGPVMLTHNDADNSSDKLWIDDQGWSIPVRALVNISGTPESFTASSGVNRLKVSDPDSIPVAGGVPLAVVVDDYAIVEVLDGKILKDAAKVWQDKEKAVSDSIFLLLKFSAATFNYTSREINRTEEDGSTTTYYIWEEDANFYQVGDPVDTLIIAGHRQTGWEVYL